MSGFHAHNHAKIAESHQGDRARLVKAASIASIATAFCIILAKLFGYLVTDSVTMLAALLDSLLDIAASIINFIAIRFALLPANTKYRFGYSRAEDLAVFTQSAFFGISGVFLAVESVKRIIHPSPIDNDSVGIGIMIFAIILTLGLVSFQKYVIKRTKSTVIRADYLHYLVDLITNCSVIVSLVLSSIFQMVIIDALFGFGIAMYILVGAWQLFIRALRNLLDQEISKEEKEQITQIILSHKEVKEVHDFKSRYAGSKLFLQFHIELDGEMKLITAHKICDGIEHEIMSQFPGAEILIHKDPIGHEHHKEFANL